MFAFRTFTDEVRIDSSLELSYTSVEVTEISNYYYYDSARYTFDEYLLDCANFYLSDGNLNNACWYFNQLADFYPYYYAGHLGLLKCMVLLHKGFDFEESEKYMERAMKSCKNEKERAEVAPVYEDFKKQWPQVLKNREKREAYYKKLRADNFYNMKFVRHDGRVKI